MNPIKREQATTIHMCPARDKILRVTRSKFIFPTKDRVCCGPADGTVQAKADCTVRAI